MTQFDFKPGIYEVTNKDGLQVRGTPDALHGNGNVLGQKFTTGKRIPVYRVVADKNNNGWIWGVITPDNVPAQQTLYVCLWNLNTVFAGWIAALESSMPDDPFTLMAARVTKLETWLKLHGYQP